MHLYNSLNSLVLWKQITQEFDVIQHGRSLCILFSERKQWLLSGFNGAPGTPGGTGQPGFNGVPGATGNPGPSGNPGFNGAPGRTGVAGAPGFPGGPGASGAPGPSGRPGTPGFPGSAGNFYFLMSKISSPINLHLILPVPLEIILTLL